MVPLNPNFQLTQRRGSSQQETVGQSISPINNHENNHLENHSGMPISTVHMHSNDSILCFQNFNNGIVVDVN